MPLLFFILFLFLAVGGRGEAMASPPPTAGVQIKPEWVTIADLNAIRAAGFTHVRMPLHWPAVELSKGRYDWNVPLGRKRPDPATPRPDFYTYEEMVQRVLAAGLTPVIVLRKGNPLYTGGTDLWDPPVPQTDEQIDGFVRFAAASVRYLSLRYGADRMIWTIWNEPNRDPGYVTAAPRFAKLLAASCRAIKAAVPMARVMGPGMGEKLKRRSHGDLDQEFIGALMAEEEIKHCLDAFTIHPYRVTPPVTALDDYPALRALVAPLPLAVDELGVTAYTKHLRLRHPGITDMLGQQAAIYAQQRLVQALAGMPLHITYEWQDSGENPDEPEHGFGLLDRAGRPRPAFAVARTLNHWFQGGDVIGGAQAVGCEGVVMLWLRNNGRLLLAAWHDGGTVLRLNSSDPGIRAYDVTGFPQPLSPRDGQTQLLLTPLPRLILLPFSDTDAVTLSCMAH